MSLKEYRGKRDFAKTAEPRAGKVRRHAGRRFVIQKHAASRLHYDFRLEMQGTLKSWAVPKGVPLAKGEKRLAVRVEDHPVSYIAFEGSIPKGQYGGGTVMVWDRGTFEPLSRTPARDLAAGKLHFVLHGKKLEGEWYLVRLRDESQWLLIRGGKDLRPISKKQEDTSALSGKSMAQIAHNRKMWQSNHSGKKPPTRRKKAARASLPKFVPPMKARLVDSPPAGGHWTYEIKFDGYRALGLKAGAETRLISRNEKDLSDKFPEIRDALGALEASRVIIDGEIVALDAQGRSFFQLLQAFATGAKRPFLCYYAFDLPYLDGEDLTAWPLEDRKARLKKILPRAPGLIRYSASLEGSGEKLLRQAKRLGLEGLIGKRSGSPYEPGRRSGAWIKLKTGREQEFVIGGSTSPRGIRNHFGALLLGVYDGKKLLYSGKVGTGFDEASLEDLHARMAALARKTCPFANLPEERNGRDGQRITPLKMKDCHWVKPQLVAQIRFSEWTRDGRLRQPVFLGLREDRNASEVHREEPS